MADENELSPFALDNFDPRPSDTLPLVEVSTNPKTRKRVAVIRTSDRQSFRRCRRNWGWSSHLRGNLGSRSAASPLWLGSGFHFALEDFHGNNIYGHPTRALQAYAIATHKKGGGEALPPMWKADLELGKAMLAYYADDWLSTRDSLATFIHNGTPQLEVNFRVEVPYDATKYGYDEVVYSGTLDRVAIDENGILWILEYKSAKAIQTSHYETDSQVTTYCWAASLLYPGYTIGGVIYQQHRKTLPDEPRMLANGVLSTAKTQSTDYYKYRRALLSIYGSINNSPVKHVDLLNHLCADEDDESNKYIRRDRLYRNEHQTQAEGNKILMEIDDMLNPDLNLYPNPSRDCGFCSFRGPCIAIDDGGDWEHELNVYTMDRPRFYDSWRHVLPAPDELEKGVRYSFND
jgi:hypothetical protein